MRQTDWELTLGKKSCQLVNIFISSKWLRMGTTIQQWKKSMWSLNYCKQTGGSVGIFYW